MDGRLSATLTSDDGKFVSVEGEGLAVHKWCCNDCRIDGRHKHYLCINANLTAGENSSKNNARIRVCDVFNNSGKLRETHSASVPQHCNVHSSDNSACDVRLCYRPSLST